MSGHSRLCVFTIHLHWIITHSVCLTCSLSQIYYLLLTREHMFYMLTLNKKTSNGVTLNPKANQCVGWVTRKIEWPRESIKWISKGKVREHWRQTETKTTHCQMSSPQMCALGKQRACWVSVHTIHTNELPWGHAWKWQVWSAHSEITSLQIPTK